MRALITGITGFVGKYLASYLQTQGIEVFGTTSQVDLRNQTNIFFNDLMDEKGIIDLLETISPNYIYHLAGQSNVKESWSNKTGVIQANVNLTLNLLEATRKSSIFNSVKILTVGSSEEYGRVTDASTPTSEDTKLNPTTPYGISKTAVSLFTKQYYDAYGLNVLHVRPFNHIGPGQKLGFVVSDFSTQIINIERELQENVIYVGNLGAKRDFTDVRDIVRAYYMLLHSADTKYGDVYNVCTGVPVEINNILQQLVSLSNTTIQVRVDESKMRSLDVPTYVGNNSKIYQLTGWKPLIPLETTLSDVLNHLRKEQGGITNVERLEEDLPIQRIF